VEEGKGNWLDETAAEVVSDLEVKNFFPFALFPFQLRTMLINPPSVRLSFAIESIT
jgi:hypothetical protein